jgi:hypothetical protein
MVDLGRQQDDFEVLELYKTRAMGSFPEMRYEETEVWTKDATGNPVWSENRVSIMPLSQLRQNSHIRNRV